MQDLEGNLFSPIAFLILQDLEGNLFSPIAFLISRERSLRTSYSETANNLRAI